MTKKLTIGIPCYNHSEELRDVLLSIFAQIDNKSFEEIEILISDNSENFLIKDVLEKDFSDKNITYIKNQRNIEFDRNVDQVIKKSTGKFCWTLSSNDPIDNGSIKSILDTIDKYPDIGHICFDFANNEITHKSGALKLFKNYEDFLITNNFEIIGGLISLNIFNKKYLPEDTTKYYDNYWMHLSLLLEITANRPFIIIKNKFKKIINPNQKCNWAKNGHTFTTYTELHSIIMNLKKFGYNENCINEYHKRFIKGLPHQVVTARLFGLKFNKKSLHTLYEHSKNEKFTLILCFFILITPVSMLKSFKKLWKII